MSVMILSMTGEVLEEPASCEDGAPRRPVEVLGLEPASGALRLEPAGSGMPEPLDERARRGLLAMQCLASR